MDARTLSAADVQELLGFNIAAPGQHVAWTPSILRRLHCARQIASAKIDVKDGNGPHGRCISTMVQECKYNRALKTLSDTRT